MKMSLGNFKFEEITDEDFTLNQLHKMSQVIKSATVFADKVKISLNPVRVRAKCSLWLLLMIRGIPMN